MVFEDPVDHSQFESCYEKGDTYNNLFGDFSSSYEECRADLSGLYLSKLPDVYKVFDFKEDFAKDLLWLNTMGEIRKGALGQISAYNPATKKWKQAHTQGAWVITNYLLQNQKQKVLEIKLNEK